MYEDSIDTPATESNTSLTTGRQTATGAHAPRSRAARNYHENDQLANSRSNYRRTSNRYTSKGRKFKKVLIASLVVLGIMLVLAGTALGLAHWAGLFRFSGEVSDDNTTLISLHNRGNEALLPTVNVDTLVRTVGDLEEGKEGVYTFSTSTTKDYEVDADALAAIRAAVTQAEAALLRNPVTTTAKPQVTETEGDAEAPEAEATEGETTQTDGNAQTTETDANQNAGTQSSVAGTVVDDGIDRSNISFIAIDLADGGGIAYNIDGYVYGGGSIKALFATYFASQLLDSAKASEEVDGARVVQALQTTGDTLYEQLYRAYESYGWNAWIGGIGAKSSTSANGYYPSTNARMQTKAWLNVYRYLTGRTAYATWLGTQLEGQKNTLTTQAVGTGHTITIDAVLDEKGKVISEGYTIDLSALSCEMLVWSYGAGLSDATTGQYCLVENAIILVGEKSYLFTVMTGLTDTNTNREVVATLISSLAHAIVEIPEVEEPTEVQPAA